MNMAERIQYLRKTKGISQEELADQVGVSRQAVSKWESEQSVPELDKIITMSEYFEVTTDFILKGIEPAAARSKNNPELTSNILYTASAALVAIGLFRAIGEWHESQTWNVVMGSIMIQMAGISGYFIGKLLSAAKPSFTIAWFNLIGILFMPISMLSGGLSIFVCKRGWIAPYPSGFCQWALFAVIYLSVSAGLYIALRRRRK